MEWVNFWAWVGQNTDLPLFKKPGPNPDGEARIFLGGDLKWPN